MGERIRGQKRQGPHVVLQTRKGAAKVMGRKRCARRLLEKPVPRFLSEAHTVDRADAGKVRILKVSPGSIMASSRWGSPPGSGRPV